MPSFDTALYHSAMKTAEARRLELLAAFPGDRDFVIECIIEDWSLDRARDEYRKRDPEFYQSIGKPADSDPYRSTDKPDVCKSIYKSDAANDDSKPRARVRERGR